MYLKPSEIFFSQDSINNVFDKNCSHRYEPIGETLDALCEGRCSVNNIPTISVMRRDGKWFTADNRRLWVFRNLERLGKCEEVFVRETNYIPSSKFTTYNGGSSVYVRGSPGGIWHRRPSMNKPSLPKLPKVSNTVPITTFTNENKENIGEKGSVLVVKDISKRLQLRDLGQVASDDNNQREPCFLQIDMSGLDNDKEEGSISPKTDDCKTQQTYLKIDMSGLDDDEKEVSITPEIDNGEALQTYENKGYISSPESIDTAEHLSTDICQDINSQVVLDEKSMQINIDSCDNAEADDVIVTVTDKDIHHNGEKAGTDTRNNNMKKQCWIISVVVVLILLLLAVLIPICV